MKTKASKDTDWDISPTTRVKDIQKKQCSGSLILIPIPFRIQVLTLMGRNDARKVLYQTTGIHASIRKVLSPPLYLEYSIESMSVLNNA